MQVFRAGSQVLAPFEWTKSFLQLGHTKSQLIVANKSYKSVIRKTTVDFKQSLSSGKLDGVTHMATSG